jgi:hypothetical protein
MTLVWRLTIPPRRSLSKSLRVPPALDLERMPRVIEADELRGLLERGARAVEVLPAPEYEEEHLPDAINIPLKAFTLERLSQLDRHKPVIVYCWDDD